MQNIVTKRKSYIVGLFGLSVLGCANAGLPQPPATVDSGGGPVKIVSAYLRDGEPAVVRGMVVPMTPMPTSILGHLHVSAFASDGSVLARRTARWNGTLSGRRPEPRFYRVDLGVARSQVARLRVVYAREDHAPEEGFD